MKLIIDNSCFNMKYLQTLKKDKEYGILVVDQIFFFKNNNSFLEEFQYTIELYRHSKVKNKLASMYSKDYYNDNNSIRLARNLIENIVCKNNKIGIVDVKEERVSYYSLKKKREWNTKSNDRFNNSIYKTDVHQFRFKTLDELSENAKKFLESSVVYRTFYDIESDYFPGVGIEYAVNDRYIECGYGRASSFEKAENIALLEAIERYSSLYYPYNHEDIYSSFSEASNAIHPSKFILPTSDNNPFLKYDDNLKIYWTEAESLKTRNKVLIPEQLAVYGDSFFRNKDKQNRFIYDSSNGVSLGATYDEAILYGLLELIERDNFLTTWYGELPVNEIDIQSLGLSEGILININSAIKDGFDIKVYDISMELGVPSFWVLIRSLIGHSMYSYNAAGSNPIPSKAAESALMEALVGINIHSNINDIRNVSVPTQVLEMEDHVNYYSNDRYREAYSFLEKSSKLRLNNDRYIEITNYKVYLNTLIKKVLDVYEDIYVVNLTSEYMKKLGIFVVKVIVPGMLPMTFGTQNERVSLERINKERSRRGLEKRMYYNTYPHPFP